MTWTIEKQRESHKRWYNKLIKNPLRLKKFKERQHLNRLKRRENPEKIKEDLESTNKWRCTLNGIYISLKNRKRNDFDLNKEEFIKWYENQDKKCSYCNLTLEEIRKLPSPYNRKNGLTKYSIDRKDNDIGYTIDNITLCCFTCNTIKNNFLTYEEMLKIGKEIIEPKLRLLLINEQII